jgi:hypothetical protein
MYLYLVLDHHRHQQQLLHQQQQLLHQLDSSQRLMVLRQQHQQLLHQQLLHQQLLHQPLLHQQLLHQQLLHQQRLHQLVNLHKLHLWEVDDTYNQGHHFLPVVALLMLAEMDLNRPVLRILIYFLLFLSPLMLDK